MALTGHKDRVIVVTVTYNSSHYLEKQIKAIVKSTYPVEKIVVVDNNSNKNHKIAINDLKNIFSQMDVLSQNENLGGAGGFEKGINHILEKYPDCDWVWIMDDDAYPAPDCLDRLLCNSCLPNTGCLSPMIYGVELKEYQYYHPKNASKFLNSNTAVTTNINKLDNTTSIEIDAFVGPLVKMKVVKEIGVPDGSLFIYGDDREYTYRITRKYNMYLIKNAIINHRDEVMPNGQVNPKGLWKEYYHYRNNFLFIRKYKKNNVNGIVGEILLIKDAVKTTLSTIKHSCYKNYRMIRIKCIWKGVVDGFKGKGGKTIDPQKFVKYYKL